MKERIDPEMKTRLEETTDPFVGRSFDGYRIEGRIGSGGMGTVYKATQLSLGRAVAIKVLPDAALADDQYLERFHREADTLSRLSHPGVVTVFDRGDVDGRPYLVMEYVEGTNLRELLRRAPLPAAEALVIVRSVLSALEHAHQKGVVHRDIKPENVLLARGGVVKVADFGLSRIVAADPLTRLTRTHVVLGTYEYMAPEQRERAREADERSDLYATGVVLYETIAGELPIGNFAPLSRLRPSDCDQRLDAIVARSLEKDPERRFQAATQMADAVSAVLEGAPAESAQGLPSVSRAMARTGFDPFRFASRLDLLATITTLIGFCLFAAAFAWLLGATVGGMFTGYSHPEGSFAYAVPALGFAMLGWYCLETATALRRYRVGARQAQACLSLTAAATMFGLPYALASWWVLHTFRGRTYFDARSHGLDAASALSSIEETALQDPDAPLTGNRRPPLPAPERTSWRRTLASVGAALVLASLWGVGFLLQNRTPLRAEIAMGILAVIGTFWAVVVMPRVFRSGEKGPIYALTGIAIYAVLCVMGVDEILGLLYRGRRW